MSKELNLKKKWIRQVQTLQKNNQYNETIFFFFDKFRLIVNYWNLTGIYSH